MACGSGREELHDRSRGRHRRGGGGGGSTQAGSGPFHDEIAQPVAIGVDLLAFDIGAIPASVTPPRTWRHAAWFAVGSSLAVAVGLACAAVTLVGGHRQPHTINALPGLPSLPMVTEVPARPPSAEFGPTTAHRSGDEFADLTNAAQDSEPADGTADQSGSATQPVSEQAAATQDGGQRGEPAGAAAQAGLAPPAVMTGAQHAQAAQHRPSAPTPAPTETPQPAQVLTVEEMVSTVLVLLAPPSDTRRLGDHLTAAREIVTSNPRSTYPVLLPHPAGVTDLTKDGALADSLVGGLG